MTVTLELKPEVENRLTEKAKSLGKTVETFLIEVIEEKIIVNTQENSFYETASNDEWVAELDSAAVFSNKIPKTWDDSRESIYNQRENNQL